jgi:formylmethanofuran dehydrogenase subunit D
LLLQKEIAVPTLQGALITIRTAKQGAEMECGKWTEKYQAEIATLRMHPEDLAALGLERDGRALLQSAHGRTAVTCQAADGPRGLFFLPLGEVANRLFSAACTQGGGVPQWKYLDVTVSPYEGQDERG